MKKILVIFGTRPEAIKLAPVILTLRKFHDKYEVYVCNTEQQKELSNQTLSFFGIESDIKLDVMTSNQTLSCMQSKILNKLSEVFANNKFDITIVQGDTMTAFCGALVSFYNKVPVCHVEAGLRSNNLLEPFPEEAMRQMLARITKIHFAPTELSRDCLFAEGLNADDIYLTGNTVIDALSCITDQAIQSAKIYLDDLGVMLDGNLVLVTVHRRENHGERLDHILDAIFDLSKKFNDHQFVLPVHPNPNVKTKVYEKLQNQSNIILTQPLDYPILVQLMKHSKLILTDSGGIQEEAISFQVPILVMRYETERMEGIHAKAAKLVGATKTKIITEASSVLEKSFEESRLSFIKNPYGDGKASQKIENIIESRFV